MRESLQHELGVDQPYVRLKQTSKWNRKDRKKPRKGRGRSKFTWEKVVTRDSKVKTSPRGEGTGGYLPREKTRKGERMKRNIIGRVIYQVSDIIDIRTFSDERGRRPYLKRKKIIDINVKLRSNRKQRRRWEYLKDKVPLFCEGGKKAMKYSKTRGESWR